MTFFVQHPLQHFLNGVLAVEVREDAFLLGGEGQILASVRLLEQSDTIG